MKSWDVTIQMKPFQMKIFMVLFLIQVFKNDIILYNFLQVVTGFK